MQYPPCPDCHSVEKVSVHVPIDEFERKRVYIKIRKRGIVFRCATCKVDWLHITDPKTTEEIIEDLNERVKGFRLQ